MMKFIAVVVAIAAIGMTWAVMSTRSAPGEAPAQQEGPPETPIREAQRLTNSSFEVIPGEVITNPVQDLGIRYDIRVRVRSFETQRSLKSPFWSIAVEAFDGNGRAIPTAEARLPVWSSFGDDRSAVVPGGQLTGTVLVYGANIDVMTVTMTYDEPGFSPAEASFVYPYGR